MFNEEDRIEFRALLGTLLAEVGKTNKRLERVERLVRSMANTLPQALTDLQAEDVEVKGVLGALVTGTSTLTQQIAALQQQIADGGDVQAAADQIEQTVADLHSASISAAQQAGVTIPPSTPPPAVAPTTPPVVAPPAAQTPPPE